MTFCYSLFRLCMRKGDSAGILQIMSHDMTTTWFLDTKEAEISPSNVASLIVYILKPGI